MEESVQPRRSGLRFQDAYGRAAGAGGQRVLLALQVEREAEVGAGARRTVVADDAQRDLHLWQRWRR